MSRSKSPDMTVDKKSKPRLKSIGTNQYSNLQYTPSAQFLGISNYTSKNRVNSICNNRSSKLLKPKRSLKGIKSPLSKSPSNSVIHTAKDEGIEKYSNPLTIRTENFRKIEEMLRKINYVDSGSSELTADEKFEVFSKVFDEIIEKDKQFSRFLMMIKNYYQSYYEQKLGDKSVELLAYKKEQEKLTSSFAQEKNSLQRTVETLSRENLQLSRDLEKCEDHISTLQEQLEIIHSFDVESIPKSKESWKCLVLENKYYNELCKNLKKELEIYKQNQEMFILKFDELKAQGVEVSYEFSECYSSVSSISEPPTETKHTLIKNKSIPYLNFSRLSSNSHYFN